MITYRPVKSVDDIIRMTKYLVTREATEESQKVCSLELQLRMQQAPETINIIQAWDGQELISYVVGILPPGKTYMSFPQCWSKTGNAFEIAEVLFSSILMWAVTSGRTSIVGECPRAAGPLFRRYGFVEIAKVIERKITAEEIEKIRSLGKEIIHG